MTCVATLGLNYGITRKRKKLICLKIINWLLSLMLHLFKALIIRLYSELFKKKIPIRRIKNNF